MKNKIFTILICLSMLVPSISHAQLNFGGKIVSVNECFCSGGWMIWVYDAGKKTVLPIVFQFGYSSLKPYYNIFTYGVSVLGSATPGGVCILASTLCEVTIPAVGTVSTYGFPGIGTTAF